MTYEEYVLSKTNKFVYRGQSEEELKIILQNSFGYNCSAIRKGDEYIPVKPPAGTIFVGNDVNNGWIADKKAFYGWNIQFVKGLISDEIKFK
jgi:hypothetical protein